MSHELIEGRQQGSSRGRQQQPARRAAVGVGPYHSPVSGQQAACIYALTEQSVLLPREAKLLLNAAWLGHLDEREWLCKACSLGKLVACLQTLLVVDAVVCSSLVAVDVVAANVLQGRCN